MKKKLSTLGVVMLLIFSLAGCGANNKEEVQYDQGYMISNVERIIESINVMNEQDIEMFKNMPDVQLTLTMVSAGLPMEGPDFLAMIDSWQAATDECGPLKAIEDFSFEAKKDGAEITAAASFEDREADIVVEFDEKMNMDSLTVNAHYSTGEILEKAGLNTILGMGTVFVVLIFISFIISLFKYIPDIQEKFSKKNKPAEKAATPAPAIVEAPVATEESTDDEELVAAIAAAIAAYEGTSTDDFVVRSIKRRKSNRWM